VRVLSLDLSTSTGWAILDYEKQGLDPKPVLVSYGIIKLDKIIHGYGDYPWSYIKAARAVADQIVMLVVEKASEKLFDLIVIEETNLNTRSRYAQKILEFIHCSVLRALECGPPKIVYVSSSEWRHNLGLTLSKADKKNNQQVSKAKAMAKAAGISIYEAKAKVGVKGRVTKKHVAINFVNDFYGLALKTKDDDIADAICLALSAINGANLCNGV